MNPKILFRKALSDPEEFEAAKKYFDVIELISDIKKGDLIIPRYSALPYFNELEQNTKNLGGSLIQSYIQHKWIADFDYYKDIRRYTFDSWETGEIYNAPEHIAYVVKGKTNSRKWRWNTDMFASNKKEAIKLGVELYGDGLIGPQGIIYRRYEPLKKLEEGINGLPFSNEYRFFYLKDKLIDCGFYWAIAEEENIPKKVPKGAIDLADKVAKIACKKTNFFVLDVAEKEDGDWILVEINCGTMSGLSCIDSENFYKNLKDLISG